MRTQTWEYAYQKRDRLGRYEKRKALLAGPIGITLLMILTLVLNHFNSVN